MRTTRSLATASVAMVALLAVVAGLALGSDAEPAPRDAAPAPAQPRSDAAAAALYHQSCASCHGPDGAGTEFGPSLLGVGAASVDFQLSTGRMPFAGQPGEQAQRKPPAFDADQIAGLVDHVVRLSADQPRGPDVPVVTIDEPLLARGHEIYVGSCAPCHGSTGNGGAVGGGALAPPLDRATPVQVGEAMLVGPGQMPIFALPPEEIDAVATYVEYLRTAPDPGGFSIGGIGPVPEGFVAWVLGMGLLLVIVYLIGREWDRSAVRDGEQH